MRLQGRLVLAEPRIAEWPQQIDLRIEQHLGRDAAQVLAKPFDDLDHRLTAMGLVLLAARVKPLALVIALQRAQERQSLRREHLSIMISKVIEELRRILGDRVSTSDSVREHHSHGESWHAPGLPDFVVFPQSTEEGAAIVKLCAQHRLPIVPFGMGSSLEGHVNAIKGGVSIDLTRMTKVVRLSPEDLDITVEAGLTRLKL